MSDRQAADAVRGRIDWKYALGLELTDPNFDFSVFSEFRDRLVVQQASNRLRDVLLDVFKARGLLKARGRQRTDSTYILEAARELNRLERAGETLRSTLNTLAQLAPEWLKRVAPAEWFARYRRRFDDLHLPRAQAERERLVEQIGRDGRDLLQLLDHPAAPPELALGACVATLRTIWQPQYQFEEKDGQLRVIIRRSGHLPPVREQLLSPYETEARFCVRSELKWEGYRVHLTESCDAEAAVHLVTHVETAPAPEQDETALPRIHAALHRRGLLPKEHLLDAGYVSADLLVKSIRAYGVEMVGPLVQDVSWQARAKTGYDVCDALHD